MRVDVVNQVDCVGGGGGSVVVGGAPVGGVERLREAGERELAEAGDILVVGEGVELGVGEECVRLGGVGSDVEVLEEAGDGGAVPVGEVNLLGG